MTVSTKRATVSKTKQPAKARGKPASPTDKPFLRFYHSEALRSQTLSLLAAMEHAEDPTAHRDALAGLVMELTGSGLNYYFLRPLKLAKPGFVVEQSAKLGLLGVQQVMGSVVRQVIGRMNKPQLLSVCSSIRQLML